MVGPLPNVGEDHIGGSKVSFLQMVNDLKNIDWLAFDTISISRPLASAGKLNRAIVDATFLIRTLWTFLTTGHRYDVWAVHVSAGGVFNLFPAIYLVSKFYRKPVLLRLFGGDMDTVLDSSSTCQKWLFNKTAARTHKLILQTQSLINNFQSLGNTEWLPTTRHLNVKPQSRKQCRRILFMSQIRADKGVRVAVEAAQTLPDDCGLDFYGSPVETEMVELITNADKTTYHRELRPAEVPEILNTYDALILPTYWKGEGFPGILIEAFQCGIPVIASAWRQIPEVVEDGVNGLLVEPKSTESLSNAINAIVSGDQLYQRLAEGAMESGGNYDSVTWNKNFATWCLEAKQEYSRRIS